MTIAPPRQLGLAPAFAAASGLAASTGVGRFVYTPLLPVMTDAHRLDAHSGAFIAAVNYAGYLLGAIVLARRPEWNGRTVFQASAVVLVLSEALMAVPAPPAVPAALRLLAGVASAVLFIGCASMAARHENRTRAAGIAFSGVGAGIALAGLLVLAARPIASWQALWLLSAALTAVLLLPTWRLDIRPGSRSATTESRPTPGWRSLRVSYFLDGVGYIVIGTFLVAAVATPGHEAEGTALWIVVGVAAVPATVLWGALARRWSAATALVIALLLQTISAALPALSTSIVPVVIAAVLFGATFMGIVMLAMEIGADLIGGRAAATLTAGYGSGQMLGPLVVAPVLGTGYTAAFGIATVLLLGAAAAALAVRRAYVSIEP
ncbi:YbfB/YjiJ family MFS transporter [Nocardia sp. NPDC050406]|uniref:YbfB/YjiJ family MFS transporter n=1 Tax=Nocardia sp. NPDC050406 TaxID=3364318 RepID=UPI0037A50E3B